MPSVLITGCSTGIGRACVDAFARHGWDVAATVRKERDAAALEEIDGVHALIVDVTDARAVTAAVDEAVAAFGSLDVVVNNAGTSYLALFEETDAEEISAVMDLNFLGTVNVLKAAVPHFRAQRAGTIVNVTSTAGVIGIPMNSVYCASKFAVEGLSESLALELLPLGIAVKIVQPGATRTAIHGKWDEQRNTPISDYDGYRAWLTTRMAPNRDPDAMSSADHVAALIYGAATDGTQQLRYPTDRVVQELSDKRRELSPADFMDLLRDRFFGKSPYAFPDRVG